MKFAITVSETLSKTIIVDDERVKNLSQACKVVQNAVNNCDIVLDADDFAERSIQASEYYHLGRVPDDADTSFYSKLEVTDELLERNFAGKARYTYEEIKDELQKVNVRGHICEFCDCRLDRNSIPEEKYMYEVAGDDDCGDIPCRVRNVVLVNFFGTLICDEELPLEVDSATASNGVMWLNGGYDDFIYIDKTKFDPAITFDDSSSENVEV